MRKKLISENENVDADYIEPHFDFRYLHIIPGKDFYDLAKHKNGKYVFKEIQEFLYVSMQEYRELDEIINAYTSPRGSKISSKSSDYVKAFWMQ